MNTDVQQFYDAFRDQRMIGYRVDGSPRLDAAFQFAKRHLGGRKTIADVGCGIGIFADLIGREYPSARVIAVDISEKNIAYARKTVAARNVMFDAASVTEQFPILRELADGPIDAFCLIDVIEHIPDDLRAKVFLDIAGTATESATLVLTYPSPEYQLHLMSENPTELQIIDNVLEVATLISEAEQAGWRLKEFRYVDLWLSNQYVHAAFEKRLPLETCDSNTSIARKIWFHFDRIFLRPGRLRRYTRT
ncbi:class I SAM-dependent methyltransferase [Rhodomicrobium sp. Az07]|uniref:class I SAM-dependent methyltransferase n=1 Tax=Rhodomicrobium sp. Az07 TaxID=2839034 RepID=UPI001BE7C4BC|nr:class I SAM-dependent methyltransferase [Rhodomicrobium sp. Az07]MBT3072162.1 class I SAM-dependent methyltransferase [Rhodomicrobium sp. Az07]